MRYNEQKVLPYIRAMVWRCYKISLRGFRRELRIVSKCGCLSEPEGRVAQEHLRIRHVHRTEIVVCYSIGVLL